MKKQIRLGTFETVSSSVHAFCFSPRGLGKCRLKIHEDGYVHVTLDQYFGKDEDQFFDQRTKLKYILSWVYTYHNFDQNEIEDSYILKDFNEEFSKYVIEHNGVFCRGVKVNKCKWDNSYDYFDHQQLDSGWSVDHCLVSIWDAKACVEFIFNKNIGLQTGCD